METNEAARIIQALANGVDPATGEAFAESSPYNHPQTIRALFHALKALERTKSKAERARHLPANTGKPWSSEEDTALCETFDTGTPVKDIAASHSRTAGGIVARLAKLGRIVDGPEGFQGNAKRTSPGQQQDLK